MGFDPITVESSGLQTWTKPGYGTLVNGKTRHCKALDASTGFTKVVIGLDCMLVPTGDGADGKDSKKMTLTPRALVSRIGSENNWFRRHKDGSNGGDVWKPTPPSGRGGAPMQKQETRLPQLTPRSQAAFERRRTEILERGMTKELQLPQAWRARWAATGGLS